MEKKLERKEARTGLASPSQSLPNVDVCGHDYCTTSGGFCQLSPGVDVCGQALGPRPEAGAKPDAPPSSNTGVLSTGVVLDWLSGTFLDMTVDESLRLVREVFGEIVELDSGFMGYERSGLILGGKGRVMWSPSRPDMGVHVILPGDALGELSRDSAFQDTRGFLVFLAQAGFRFSRLDFAVDDVGDDGVLDFGEIYRAVRAGEYTSRWRKWTYIENSEGGRTILFGSRESDSCLRIYDKAAERGEDGHWIRVELEVKRKRACHVAAKFVEGGVGFILCLIRGYLEFKEPVRDANKSRWPVAAWWAQFLGFFRKLRLCLPKPARSLARVYGWIRHQVAPSLALLTRAQGGLDWLYPLLREGDRRLRPYHLALLESSVQRGTEVA